MANRIRGFVRVALLMLIVSSWSCSGTEPPRALHPGELRVPSIPLGMERDPSRPHSIVLVAIDGVRWTDVFRGVERERGRSQGLRSSEILSARELVPNLSALAASGVAFGDDDSTIIAGGPSFVSLPGYLELLTGRKTSCLDNDCGSVSTPTLADEFAAEPGVGPHDVAVIASWDRLERAAASSPEHLIVSAGRTHGVTRDRLRYDRIASALLERGESDGPEPGSGDFRRDRATSAIALHYLKTQRPRFLFVGLGETDELAHKDDYRGYLTALVAADRTIGEIAAILSAYEREGRRTTLLITTDHGRGADFAGHGSYSADSARVWLVAAGDGIPAERPKELAGVGRLIRTLAVNGRSSPDCVAGFPRLASRSRTCLGPDIARAFPP